MTFDELLETLNYLDTEFVAICHSAGNQFNTAVLPPADAPTHVNRLPATADIWYSVNPTSGPVRTNAGRGDATKTTRLAALWCDLDIKPGGCPDIETAQHIITTLAELLNEHPCAVIASGHGLQPYWPIEDGYITNEFTHTHAQQLLRRWGRLVTAVAQRHNTKVDNVYDLPRILRVPGTTNNKNPAAPVAVTAQPHPGAPVTIAQIDERLAEAGIYPQDSDTPEPAETVVAPPNTWTWATHPCGYAHTMITSWTTDTPTARHPWLISQAIRLAAAHRRGCLTHHTYTRAERQLAERFHHLCTTTNPARPVGAYEIPDALNYGRTRAATLTDTALRAELGNHLHTHELAGGIGVTTSPPTPAPSPGNVTPMPTKPPPSPPPPAGGEPNTLATVTPLPKRTSAKNITLTDTGNAQLLAHHHAPTLRYCPELARWLTWNQTHWQITVDNGPAVTAARDTITNITADGNDAIAKHKIRSLSRNALEAMVALAKTDPTMRTHRDQLDNDPCALNTPSGVINLHTGAITAHTPQAWHTKMTGVAYHRDQPAPAWHRFLTTTFGGSQDLIGYVQRLAGYAATGRVTHHVLPFLHGSGQNGKSVLLDVLTAVLGDYAITAPANFLLAGQTKHETEIARLAGARLVVCSEVNQDSRFDEAKIKALTGGDKITGRFMRQDFFDFTPTHTLFLAGNHQPQVTAGGRSFWRRLRLIPFRHEVPPDQRNENLAQELIHDEGPAILAWIVAGAVDMHTHGLDEPESVAAATGEYEEQEDALKRFLGECCRLGGGLTVKTKTSVVLARYQRWARENGEREMTAISLGRELASRFGIKSIKSDSTRFYQSLALLSDDDEQRDRWWDR